MGPPKLETRGSANKFVFLGPTARSIGSLLLGAHFKFTGHPWIKLYCFLLEAGSIPVVGVNSGTDTSFFHRAVCPSHHTKTEYNNLTNGLVKLRTREALFIDKTINHDNLTDLFHDSSTAPPG